VDRCLEDVADIQKESTAAQLDSAHDLERAISDLKRVLTLLEQAKLASNSGECPNSLVEKSKSEHAKHPTNLPNISVGIDC